MDMFADRQQRSGEFVVSGIYGKWARDVRLERDFQSELKAHGIEWERKKTAGSSACAGGLKALFEDEARLRHEN